MFGADFISMKTAHDLAILVGGSLRGYRKCRIFESILDDCWRPLRGRDRQAAQIRSFAKRRHWKVHLRIEGLRLMADFEKRSD